MATTKSKTKRLNHPASSRSSGFVQLKTVVPVELISALDDAVSHSSTSREDFIRVAIQELLEKRPKISIRPSRGKIVVRNIQQVVFHSKLIIAALDEVLEFLSGTTTSHLRLSG